MLVHDYGIKRNPITVRNPQANAIVERIHQVIANMVRTFDRICNGNVDTPKQRTRSNPQSLRRQRVRKQIQCTQEEYKGKTEHNQGSWYPRVKDNKASNDGDNSSVDEFLFYL